MSANTQPPPPVKFFEFWKTLDEKMAEKLGRVSKTNFYKLPRPTPELINYHFSNPQSFDPFSHCLVFLVLPNTLPESCHHLAP